MPQAHCVNRFQSLFKEDSNLFWIVTAILTALSALLLAWPFIRPTSAIASRAEHDVQALRSQLSEVDQDLLRGVLTKDEAESARIELSRRLLAAAGTADTSDRPAFGHRGGMLALGTGAVVLTAAAAYSVYISVGSPALSDRPLEGRDFRAERTAVMPSQEQTEAQITAAGATSTTEPTIESSRIADVVAQAKARIAEDETDVRAWQVVALGTAQLERYGETWRALKRVSELVPDLRNPELYGDMTEAMVFAAGGYVSPEAEEAADTALEIDQNYHQARFYKALAYAQRGEMQAAVDGWSLMLKEGPIDAPWRSQVEDNLRRAASEADVDVDPSLIRPGPTAEQRAAAANMSKEDRDAMIAGMVDNLAAKLEEDPSDLGGWLQLIRAYQVLGRDDDARAAQVTARKSFVDDSDATAKIDGAF